MTISTFYSNEFSENSFRRHFINDLFLLIALSMLAFYFVYFSSAIFSQIFFLVTLFLFLFSSKKNYFWFAYFFILSQGPGYFFSDLSGSSQHRLPLFSLIKGFSFTPIDIFVMIAFIKAIKSHNRPKLKFKNLFLFLIGYMIICGTVTSLVFGTSADTLAWNLRWIFYYTIVLSFTYLINKEHEVYEFFMLITPIVFFILFTQIYYVKFGIEFINLFHPDFRAGALILVTGAVRPVVGGAWLVFISFAASLILMENKFLASFKWYLYSVCLFSFFAVFFSATRGGFSIFSLIMILYLIVTKKKIISYLKIACTLIVMFGILVSSGIILKEYLIYSSWGRLSQLTSIAQGNVQAVDTADSRFFVQLPTHLPVIFSNIFVGYGFSGISMDHYDNDLGFVNTILFFGLFGFFLFIALFINIFKSMHSARMRLSAKNPYSVSLKLISIIWAGILLGYLSTLDFFSYYFQTIFFTSLLLSLTEFIYRKASDEMPLLQ